MKRILTLFFLVGVLITSCSGTGSVMKDILKNMEETDENIQFLVNELGKDKVSIKKIEDFHSKGEELAEARDELIEKYQDYYYKDKKGVHVRLKGFKETIKEDEKYSEYNELEEKIKSSSAVAGVALRSAIFSDLNGDGGKIPEILDTGSEDFGTGREIYNWYFFNDFEDEISDFKEDVLRIDDFNGRMDLIEEYMKDNPWLLFVAKDFESLFEYVVKTKNSFWKPTNSTLNMMQIGKSFSDILGPEEIRDAIVSNHS